MSDLLTKKFELGYAPSEDGANTQLQGTPE